MNNNIPSKHPHVHFIGIGGIGMSSLAKWFRSQNWNVSGSDLVPSIVTREAEDSGIRFFKGHAKGRVNPRTDLVIYSQAVKPENPEFKDAKRLKTPLLSYPEMVGRLTRMYSTIAVAGAHGKSSTTSLIGLALTDAKLDPTIIVGTRLKELKEKNFRKGKGPYLVLEADEYGKAFLHYSPVISVITTIDKEHLDTYGTLAEVKRNFLAFIAATRKSGVVILNRDDKNIASIASQIKKITAKKGVRVMWYSLKNPIAAKMRRALKLIGEHNVSNALGALEAGKLIGIPEARIVKTFSRFKGAWRRMEYRGTFRGAKVYDDYAHHPTEIKASLKGLKNHFKDSHIICVFQPHQADRLKRLFDEFKGAFHDAHLTIILPIYRVAGRDEKPTPYDAKALVEIILKENPKSCIEYLSNPKILKKSLLNYGKTAPLSKSVIVMMGAGSIVDLTESLLK